MGRFDVERSVTGPYGTKHSVRADSRLAAVAARQWGVVSLADLTSCGLTIDAIKKRIRIGRLHRIHRGVYAVGHPSIPFKGEMLAAVLACGPAAALSHFAGSAFYSFVEWDGREPDVTIPGSARRKHPGIRVHRSNQLEPRDVTTIKGMRITTRTRTLIDLAAVVDYPTLRRAVRQALSLKRVTLAQLAKELARLGPRRGSANLTRILSAGHAPTRSDLEDVVLDLILRGGLELPRVNEPLWLGGRKIIPDFRWPAQRLVIEADSRTWHDNELAREDDAVRQALLEADGERVLRVTWEQAISKRQQTLERIRRAGAPFLDRAER